MFNLYDYQITILNDFVCEIVDDATALRGEAEALRGVRQAQIKLATIYLLNDDEKHARL